MAKTYIFDPAKIGQKGGQVRAARLSPERRSIIARNAAIAKHHPDQFKREKARVERIADMIQQMLSSKTNGDL